MAPGLSWAFDGADGGDLIAAAATGGVPHPTGYPTYLVLASAFLRLPVGSLAFRTNLLSLVAALVAASMIYAIVKAATQNGLAAALASIVFGTAPLVWSQAIITEVYSLQALLTVLFLGLLLVSRPRPFVEPGLGLVAGLSLGNHMMGVLLLPLLLLRPQSQNSSIRASTGREEARPADLTKIYVQRLVGLGAGLAVFLAIPFRAVTQPPVNWGNVGTLQDLLWLVSGRMYWTRLDQVSGIYALAGARSWAHLVSEQMTIVGLLLALLGLIVLFRPTILHVATLWMAISSSVLSILYYSPDSYVYAIPLLVSCSLWIGIGIHWLSNWASSRIAHSGSVVLLASAGLFLLRGVLQVPHMDLSNDRQAEDFSRAILAAAPLDSILLAKGDEATFALWYFHFGLRERPDLAVVSGTLLAHGWYHEVLSYTYPDLVVPNDRWESLLTTANPGRQVCQVTSLRPPVLECTGKITGT